MARHNAQRSVRAQRVRMITIADITEYLPPPCVWGPPDICSAQSAQIEFRTTYHRYFASTQTRRSDSADLMHQSRRPPTANVCYQRQHGAKGVCSVRPLRASVCKRCLRGSVENTLRRSTCSVSGRAYGV